MLSTETGGSWEIACVDDRRAACSVTGGTRIRHTKEEQAKGGVSNKVSKGVPKPASDEATREASGANSGATSRNV